MELLTKLERTVADWMKAVPHLPMSWRVWLGNNVWWIVVIGVVACILAVLGTLGVLTGSMAFIVGLGLAGYIPGTVTALTYFSTLVGLVFLVVEGAFLIAAVTPLKAKQKRGWTLLFAAYVVSTLSVLVSAFLTLNLAGFIIGVLSGAVGIAIGAYFLFEIRDEFMKKKAKA